MNKRGFHHLCWQHLQLQLQLRTKGPADDLANTFAKSLMSLDTGLFQLVLTYCVWPKLRTCVGMPTGEEVVF